MAEDQTGESTPEQTDLAPSKRTRVRRLAERGHYDRETVHAILDEGFVCHVGTLDSTGSGPVVIPTAYCRVGDLLYLHGAPANAGLRQASSGTPICVTVTLVDGLVLARSAFHHSINYRSVVIYANATEVTDPEEKGAAMAALVEHIVPGRGADARESDSGRAPSHPGRSGAVGRGVRQDPHRRAEGRSRGSADCRSGRVRCPSGRPWGPRSLRRGSRNRWRSPPMWSATPDLSAPRKFARTDRRSGSEPSRKPRP